VVLIRWGEENSIRLYALWCQFCREIKEVTEAGNNTLRCKVCNHKVGELVDKDYTQALMEGRTIQ
jgi:hypothetical protein